MSKNLIMETIILGLGSNRGDSKAILTGAIERLVSFLDDTRTSSVYITKPQDYCDQDDFYNMIVSGNYAGSPASLLKTLQHIEADYGRNREAEIPKGPRTIDIDILFFGNQIVSLRTHPAAGALSRLSRPRYAATTLRRTRCPARSRRTEKRYPF